MPVATTMFMSTAALTRWMRGMWRPSPSTVGSTIVSIPPARATESFSIASATRTSSSQYGAEPHTCPKFCSASGRMMKMCSWGSVTPRAPASTGPRTASTIARRDRLDRPAVAVRVLEEEEVAPGEALDVGDLDAAPRELVVGGLDVADHELKPLRRAGLGVDESRADGDRARRARWRELDEADLVADDMVVIGVEARLLG